MALLRSKTAVSAVNAKVNSVEQKKRIKKNTLQNLRFKLLIKKELRVPFQTNCNYILNSGKRKNCLVLHLGCQFLVNKMDQNRIFHC